MISIVVPTLNEARSIPVLAANVAAALAGEEYELIVVDDDSADRTWEVAGGLPAELRVRVLRRQGKRGLSSAVLEGIGVASGEVVGVMDADLSHPADALPGMIERLRSGEADLVVASRLVPGGGTEGWPRSRKLTSRLGTLLARPLTAVRDPMSGYLLFKRSVVDGAPLTPRGYKIGLEILVKGNARRVVEVPIVFRDRTVGESKLGLKQNLEFLAQVLDLYWYRLKKRA